MELAHYGRVLRARWVPFTACVVLCVLGAAALAALATPMYEARAQLFVSSGNSDRDQTYEGGLLAQQRARSYAELVSTPGVVQAVIDELGLRSSVPDVQRQLAASVPVDTVLIDVTATAASAQRAKAMADAVAGQLPRFVNDLETAPGDPGSPVELRVASRAELPADPSFPRTPVYLALGPVLGLALGVAVAVLLDALDDRVRTDQQAAAAAGVPVLGSVVDGSPDSYRRLRANLSAVAAADGMRLLMTSIGAERVASRAVTELGVALAETGRTVVLVDANLWRPKLHELVSIPNSTGLAGILLDGAPVDDAVQPWERDPRIEVVPAGATVGAASDVLKAGRLAKVFDTLAARADFVIVDSPSLVSATDAAVMAPLMSGVLLVTRLSSTRARQLEAAVRELTGVGAQILGLVTVPAKRSWGRERRRAPVTPRLDMRAGGAR
jgi:tyrosine-protein kinase